MISPISNIDFNLVTGINNIGCVPEIDFEKSRAFLLFREKYLSLSNAMNFRNII